MQGDTTEDPYHVLGLAHAATAADLKRAYRRLSKAWHPDNHAGASEAQRREAERQFKRVHAAYLAVGEQMRAAQAGQPVGAGAAWATTSRTERPASVQEDDRNDPRVEAIRAAVASVALRMLPTMPRHSYRRITAVAEHMLIDTMRRGEQVFAHGFEMAFYEAMIAIGMNADLRKDALNVLDAAADDLQWHGKGASPRTWQTLLEPLERAMHESSGW
jgi:hypothetical protein